MNDSGGAPPPGLEAYVIACLVHGDWQTALESIHDFGALPGYAPHLAGAASRLLGEGRYKAALQVASRALELDENCALAHSVRGRALLGAAMDEPRAAGIGIDRVPLGTAEAALRRAAELDPREVPARVALASLYLRQNRPLDAHPFVEQALAAAPWDAEAREALKRLRKSVDAAVKASGRGERMGAGERETNQAEATDPQRLTAAARELRELAARAHQRCASARLPTVSLCLITRNEASNLPRVIKSVQGLCTEVVVVDTGSTDDTVRIAQQLGARVGHFTWVDDFAAARNYSLKRATGEWILVLDADDEFSRESTVALRQWLSHASDLNVVGLYRRYPYPGAQRDSVTVMPRLFRNGRGLRYEGAIHEYLVMADGQPALPETTVTVTHLHHGIDGADDVARRHERNLPILLGALEQEPENYRLLYYVGITHCERERWGEAVPYLEAAVRLLTPEIDLTPKAWGTLGFALLKANRPAQAEAVLREGLEGFPQYPNLWFCLGMVLDAVGRLEEAAAAHEAALRGRFGPSMNWHDWDSRESKPHLALCELRLSTGDVEAAARHLEAAERFTGPRPHYDQIRAAIDQTREEQAAQARARTRQEEQLQTEYARGDLPAGMRLVELMLEGGEKDRARQFVMDWVQTGGEGPEAMLARGKVLLASGEASDALAIFQAARDARPHSAEGWRAMGAALRAMDRPAEAEQALQSALSLDAEDELTLPMLGELYLTQQRWDDAARCFQRCLERQEGAWPVWLGLGKAMLHGGNLAVAIQCYQRAATLSGGSAAVRVALGEARACLAQRATALTGEGSPKAPL